MKYWPLTHFWVRCYNKYIWHLCKDLYLQALLLTLPCGLEVSWHPSHNAFFLWRSVKQSMFGLPVVVPFLAGSVLGVGNPKEEKQVLWIHFIHYPDCFLHSLPLYFIFLIHSFIQQAYLLSTFLQTQHPPGVKGMFTHWVTSGECLPVWRGYPLPSPSWLMLYGNAGPECHAFQFFKESWPIRFS